MEARTLEVQHLSGTALTLLSGAQTSEVLCGTWHDIRAQFHLDAALGRSADGNVKENDWILAHFVMWRTGAGIPMLLANRNGSGGWWLLTAGDLLCGRVIF